MGKPWQEAGSWALVQTVVHPNTPRWLFLFFKNLIADNFNGLRGKNVNAPSGEFVLWLLALESQEQPSCAKCGICKFLICDNWFMATLCLYSTLADSPLWPLMKEPYTSVNWYHETYGFGWNLVSCSCYKKSESYGTFLISKMRNRWKEKGANSLLHVKVRVKFCSLVFSTIHCFWVSCKPKDTFRPKKKNMSQFPGCRGL